MSLYLYALGRACFRLGWKVPAGWLALLAVVAGLAFTIGEGTDDSISLPGVESTDALEALAMVLPEAAGASALTVVVLPDGETVDDPAITNVIEDSALRQHDVDQVVSVASPFDEIGSGAVSDDRTAAIISAEYQVEATIVTDESRDQLNQERALLESSMPAGTEVHVGGEAFSDLVPTPGAEELVGVVIAFLVLLVLFRSLRTSFVPLATAITAVAITEMAIQTGTAAVSIMSTAPMLAMMIGLAVGIDYALFILSRYRDELGEGTAPEDAAALATATAGSAVFFSGVITVIALTGLFIVDIPFLTIMGIASALAVTLAVCVSVTAIPALLRYLGDLPARRRPRRLPRRPRTGTRRPGERAGRQAIGTRWVGLVTRRPLTTLAAGLVLAVGLALPALSLQLALPGNGSQPVGTEARDTYDVIGEEFVEGYNGPLYVTVNLLDSVDPVGDMERLGEDLARTEGVYALSMATPEEMGAMGLVELIPEWGPDTAETSELVDRLRDERSRVEADYPFREYSVTGFTAAQVDVSDRLGASVLPFVVFVVGLSLVLMVMVFRSIAVPIKAAAGYLLSLSASLGATSLVFVIGFGADELGVARTGTVVSFLPIIVMAVLFGLAMDYQIFLVSRMAEARVKGRDAITAVREGFTQSSPVVTAAALIMVSVFVAFIPQEDPNIKPIALALAVGVAVDAFLVRMTLVPAVLALLGRRAWWLPRSLENRLPYFDVEGESIAHRLRLEDWPADHPDALVSVSGLDIRDGSGAPIAAVSDLYVGPGEIAVLVGGERKIGMTALAALSGRHDRFAGDVKVAGRVLPQEARVLRKALPVYTPSSGAAQPGAAQPGAAQPGAAGNVMFIADLDGFPERAAIDTIVRTHLADGGCVVATVTTAGRADEVSTRFSPSPVIVVDATPEPDSTARPERTSQRCERGADVVPVGTATLPEEQRTHD